MPERKSYDDNADDTVECDDAGGAANRVDEATNSTISTFAKNNDNGSRNQRLHASRNIFKYKYRHMYVCIYIYVMK